MSTIMLLAHPAVVAARELVEAELGGGRVPAAWVRQLVRVEITRDVLRDFRGLVDREDFVTFARYAEDGPIKIEGLPYYVVDKLPAPGWRVIGIPE